MASNYSSTLSFEDEFSELANFLAPKISEHPTNGFELDIANWLDRSGQLLKSFERWKNNPSGGMNKSSEYQCRHLLELWKQLVGRSKATFAEFKILISEKPFTRELIEDIDVMIGAQRSGPVTNKTDENSGKIF